MKAVVAATPSLAAGVVPWLVPPSTACVRPQQRPSAPPSPSAPLAAATGFVGDASRITLVFRGRELADLRQLKDEGVDAGAVIAHVPTPAGAAPGGAEAGGLDYGAIATYLERAQASVK